MGKKRRSDVTIVLYNKGYIIEKDSELIGMAKGMDQYISERYLQYDKGVCKQKAHGAMETIKAKKARADFVIDKTSMEARIAMREVKPKEVVFYESEQIICSCRCCILRRSTERRF